MNVAYVLYSVGTTALCSLTFGISLTSFECINNNRKDAKEPERMFFNDAIPLCNTQWSILISVICIGALVSSIFHSYLRISMKDKLILNNALFILGNFLILLLSNFYVLLVGRFVIGMAIGVTCCIIPSYLYNISPPSYRGLAGTCHQLAIVIGVFLGQVLNYFFNDSHNWRNTYFIILTFLLVHTFLLLFVVDVIEESSAEPNAGFFDLFRHKEARYSIIFAGVLHAAQQMSCFNGVINYSTKILEDKEDPDLYSIYLGGISIVSTFTSLFFVERFGRKKLLLFSLGLVICGLSMLMFELKLIAALCIYISGFNFGLGPITWLLSGEIFPGKYADVGIRYSVSVNWISNGIVLFIFPKLEHIFDHDCFALFAFLCFCTYFYIMMMFKETKDRPAEFQ